MGKQRSSLRQVPWPSWAHWKWVASGLFSDSQAHISAALDRIAAWRSRGDVPIAVEITAAIIGIHQRDPQVKQGISREAALPEGLLRMMYAMAIQRLVNGVVDQSQKRSTSSVAERAEIAGLPRLLVDIRHEAAHTEIPGIALLQFASKQAMAWLKSQYWDQQIEILVNARQDLKCKIVEHCCVLVEIWTSREIAGDDLRSKEIEDVDELVQENLEGGLSVKKQQRRALFRELLDLSITSISDLISILVDDGLLGQETLPTLEDLDHKQVRTDSTGCCDLTSVTDNSWKFTLRKLFTHLPQLPGMLLVAILRQINPGSLRLPAETVESCAVDSTTKNRLASWCAWLLGKEASRELNSAVEQEPNQCKISKISNELSTSTDLSSELLHELLRMCLLTSTGRGPFVELVPLISVQIGDEKFQQRASMLAQLGTSMQRIQIRTTDTCGRIISEEATCEPPLRAVNTSSCTSDDSTMHCSKPTPNASDSREDSQMIASELALEIARRQQRSFLHRVCSVSTSNSTDTSSDCCPLKPGRSAPLKPTPSLLPRREAPKQRSSSVSCWTLAENWQPCAIGMVPSPFLLTGIIPGLEVQQSILPDQLVVRKQLAGESSEEKNPSADIAENPTCEASLLGGPDKLRVEKRKNDGLDGPICGKKSRSAGFHVRFEESVVVIDEKALTNQSGMSQGALNLEQPTSPGKEPSQDGALLQGCLLQGGRLMHVTPLLLESLQSAVHVL